MALDVASGRLAASAAHADGRGALLAAQGRRRRRPRRGRRDRPGRQASAQSLGLVHRPRGAALPPLGRRCPLRLVAVPDQSRLGVGDRAVRLVLAVGVSPLPPGVQAHRPQPPNSRRLQSERLERPEGRRASIPGFLHPRRPPGASLLRRRHMLRALRTLLAFAVIGLLVTAASAADKIRVVATIPDLKALTEAVGGKLVDVESLARGTQNAHELEIRPSLMLKLRRADILIENGLELDSWAEVAVQGANNPNIVRGAPGRVDVSRGVQVLEVPTARVDRSMGDVHPLGNPHYSLDPGQAPIVTQNIVERNREAFLARLEEAMVRWTKVLERVIVIPTMVGGVKGVDTYIQALR